MYMAYALESHSVPLASCIYCPTPKYRIFLQKFVQDAAEKRAIIDQQ